MLLDSPRLDSLTPARVLAVDGRHVTAATAAGTVRARVAVALYRPAAGDEVLLIGPDEACYVIGVLEIQGAAEVVVPGDLRLQSGGAIDLLAVREAKIRAPRMSLQAGSLTVLAEKAAEKFGSVVRRVKDCFQLRAGRTRTIVDEAAELRAGRIVQTADRDVKIDGESIDLG